MRFIRNNILLEKLFIVDGVGRSGKVLLADILSCFSTVEVQQFDEFIEYISLAFHYDKISEDIAQSILKTQLDTQLYNLMIGRSLNSRPTDSTSYYRYHSPEKYTARTTSPDGTVIAKRVSIESPIYLIWTHDLIYKSKLMFKTFGNKITYFYLNRNPIDIVYEWDLKNFGGRIGEDPTELQYLIKYQKEALPEMISGWEKTFICLNPLEKIVQMIYCCFKRNIAAIKLNKNRKNLVIINFEDLVTQTDFVINRIRKIIKLEPLAALKPTLVRENCPRELDPKQTTIRKNKILDGIDKRTQSCLYETLEMYNNIKKETDKI